MGIFAKLFGQAVRKGRPPTQRERLAAIRDRVAARDKIEDAAADLPANSDADEFVLSGQWVEVISSNWARMRYHYDDNKLFVQYHNGGVYWYSVPPHMAYDLFEASSKGIWGWDHLRVRGTRCEHQVEWDWVSGPPRKNPCK